MDLYFDIILKHGTFVGVVPLYSMVLIIRTLLGIPLHWGWPGELHREFSL